MATPVNLAQQSYTPRTINAGPNIPSGIKRIVLSCSRVSWPAGEVGSISVTMPDGSAGPSCGFKGGTAFKKDGVTVSDSSGMTLEMGDGSNLPAGNYGVQIVILQTITTAIKVETF